MSSRESFSGNSNKDENGRQFEAIAQDIFEQGYSIQINTLSSNLTNRLCDYVRKIPTAKFYKAGVGRNEEQMVNSLIRSDKISWINDETEIGSDWLSWAGSLQSFLNQRLFLGLFSFESHFARFGVGDFYKKHQDSFKGQANRILSLVLYLNPGWLPDDGGELVLYAGENEEKLVSVTPIFGTLVVFLSEEIPHEVLLSHRERFSIAGWFRLNSSSADRIDPPA